MSKSTPNVKASVATDGDSSNEAGNKIVIPRSANNHI
jgi:hypothetical protein